MTQFLVRWSILGRDDTWHSIDAYDPEMAAERFVEHHEIVQADYPVGSGREEVCVEVGHVSGLAIGQFEVRGEAAPIYYAKRI